jgi:arsenate reductase (glutaredoxin)
LGGLWSSNARSETSMSEYFPIVIHHNPDCGTSRNVVEIVRAARYEPVIIEYLQTGWTWPHLLSLFAAAGLKPRAALRETKSPAKELGLLEEGVFDDDLIEAMIAHPILVNRPIVATPKGVKLCRPSEPYSICSNGCPQGRSPKKMEV